MSCSLCRLLQVEEYQELTSLSRATTTVVCGKPAREAITLCAQAGRAYCRKMDALTNPTCPWGFRGASFQNCMCSASSAPRPASLRLVGSPPRRSRDSALSPRSYPGRTARGRARSSYNAGHGDAAGWCAEPLMRSCRHPCCGTQVAMPAEAPRGLCGACSTQSEFHSGSVQLLLYSLSCCIPVPVASAQMCTSVAH